MSHRTLTLLTWLTVVAAVVSALWLASSGAAKRYGKAPLVLGRPAPPADAALGKAPRAPAAPAPHSAPDPRR